MPGLIDAHAHVSHDTDRSPGFGPPPALHGDDPRPPELGYFILAAMARVLLDAGITTVRDVGGYGGEAIVLRQAIDLGIVPGPRILSCGRILSATSPGAVIFGTMYRAADGPWEMRKAVREQIRDGADYIKIMATGARSVVREDPEPAQMTRDEVAAVVDEAHRMGYRVAAHAEGLGGAADRGRGGRRHHRARPVAPPRARAARADGRARASSWCPRCRPSSTSPSGSSTTSRRGSSSRPGVRRTTPTRRSGRRTTAGRHARDGLRQRPPGRECDRAGPHGCRRHRRGSRDPGRDPGVRAGARPRRRGRDGRGRQGRRPARGRRRPARGSGHPARSGTALARAPGRARMWPGRGPGRRRGRSRERRPPTRGGHAPLAAVARHSATPRR